MRDLLFHLQFHAIQSERPGTGQKERMEHTISVGKFRLGILVHLTRNPVRVFPGNCPFGKTKLVFHLHSNRNFRIFFVNGKQLKCYFHMKSWAPRLALMKRLTIIRNGSIHEWFMTVHIHFLKLSFLRHFSCWKICAKLDAHIKRTLHSDLAEFCFLIIMFLTRP